MRLSRAVLLSSFFLLSCLAVNSQTTADDEPDEPPREPGRRAEADQAPTDESAQPTELGETAAPIEETTGESPPDLFEQTILADLRTAQIGELLDWARSLELSTQGSRRDVENRILLHYGYTRAGLAADAPPADEEETSGQASLLQVERARGTDFFTIDQTDEDYVRFAGGVLLTLEDGETVHEIEAQEITLNLTQNLLSAVGGVVYTTVRPGGTETFSGDSIVFEIETWSGVFLHGVTQTSDVESSSGSSGSAEPQFSVSGSRISRSPQEIITIDGGTITSSRASPPNYQIRAERIWVLAPGEWGLRNATLYVGRVPMFFFPAFFLPGDRLFFNPAVGTRSRVGAYINTTSYIFGESEEGDPPISIMRLAESTTDSERVVEGLFLRIPEEAPEPDPQGWNLAVKLDVYTNLGAYAGFEGDLPNLGPLDTLSGALGVAASRNIYRRDGDFSPWYVGQDGELRQHWNSGWFLGYETPFRYESELDTSVSLGTISLNVEYLLLSDPEFRRDFGVRSESMNWSRILNTGDSDEEEEEGATVSSLRWEVSAGWRPTVPEFMEPWVESFSVPRLTGRVDWRSRSAENLPDAVTREDSVNSPESEFYYPQSVVLPDLGVRMSGTLIEIPRRNGRLDVGVDSPPEEPESDDRVEDQLPELRVPWTPPEEPTNEPEQRFLLPELAPDAPGIGTDAHTWFELGYSLSPTLRYDRFTDNAEWDEGSDVVFDFRYDTFQTNNDGAVSATLEDPERIVSVDSNLNAEFRYQDVSIAADIPESERESLQLGAYRYRRTTIRQAGALTIRPVQNIPSISESRLSYDLRSLAYERAFKELTAAGEPRFQERWGAWREEDISTHQTRAQFVWNVFDSRQSFTATADLPPRDQRYRGALRLETGPIDSSLSGGYIREDGRWQPDTLNQQHSASFFDDEFRVSQRVDYDMEEIEVTNARTSLTAWPVDASVQGRRTTGFRFEPTVGWRSTDNERFRWTSANIGIGGEPRLVFWKRRVDVRVTGNLSLDTDLQRFTNTTLRLRYGLMLDIHEFLELEVSAASANDLVYQYIPELAEQVDRPARDPWRDIRDSLSLFDEERRQESLFKLSSIDVSAVHDLQDWELRLSYSGRPVRDDSGAMPRFRFQSVFAIELRWIPISELERTIEVDDGDLTFGP